MRKPARRTQAIASTSNEVNSMSRAFPHGHGGRACDPRTAGCPPRVANYSPVPPDANLQVLKVCQSTTSASAKAGQSPPSPVLTNLLHLPDHDEWMETCFGESEGLLDLRRLREMWAERALDLVGAWHLLDDMQRVDRLLRNSANQPSKKWWLTLLP